MKRNLLLSILLFHFSQLYSQNSIFINVDKWLTDNHFSIRKTFDGSKNEGKPASIAFQENHLSSKGFFNIDVGVKLSELELLKRTNSSLLFYPKVEWHNSTDTADLKNKLDVGINFEFIPFRLKGQNIPTNLPNKGLVISPWIQGTSSFKKNFISNSYETKLVGQISLVSNYKFLPGANIRDRKQNFRARYYPYFGYEYNYQPDLITKGEVEEFSTYFIRVYLEVWVIPRVIQIVFDGTYRQIINNKSNIRTWLPIMSPSLNLYPGKQEAISIGYEFKFGYDNESKYQLIEVSSIKINIKI